MRRWLVALLALAMCLPMVGEAQSIRVITPECQAYASGNPSIRFACGVAARWDGLLNGLVSYWKLDEVSGTRYDSVGDNDLTDNNTVGSTGDAMDGAAASFVAANSESLTYGSAIGSSPKTYSLWVLSDGTAATHRILLDKGLYLDIWHDSSSNLLVNAYVFNGTDYINAPVGWAVKPIGWLHIVVDIENGSAVNTYINDGEFSSTAVLSGNEASPNTFTLQASTGTARIDEVAIWSRVLTADERAELYAAGAGKFYPFA